MSEPGGTTLTTGELLRDRRKLLKLSKVKLAKLASVARRSIINWEQDARAPGLYAMRRVARVLGCPMEDLIGREP